MNRNQRKYGRPPKRNDGEGCPKTPPKGRIPELEEVLPPKIKTRGKGPMLNRCCYVSPGQKDFGLVTDASAGSDQYESPEIQEFPNLVPEAVAELRALRKLLGGEKIKVENASQYAKPVQVPQDKCVPAYVPASSCVPTYVETSDGSHWHSIENTDDIDRYFLQGIDEETLTFNQRDSGSIHIPEIPRIKIIAEKFTKYKKNNVQVRKLDEKVVCVEYDVFDNPKDEKPMQVMRVFFSIKPVEKDESIVKELPSKVKNKFNISSEDLSKLSQKEVEIIDDKLADNKPYLDDLKRILRRKRDLSKNNRLDLQSLYEIARKDCLHFDRAGTNALSTDELCEIKDLILKKCKSSVHGIKRRTVSIKDLKPESRNIDVISESIIAELLREERNSFVK